MMSFWILISIRIACFFVRYKGTTVFERSQVFYDFINFFL